MMVEIRDQVRPEASALGITLEDVRISRTDLTDEVSENTYRRMAAERLTEAERLRADGQVSAREIRAGADREVSETVADARREAAVLQGEGEAERNRIYAGAFGGDPEFFEFYRSMQAYRTALAANGASMVLSPDSEFFRYFKDAGVLPPTAGTGAPAAAAQPASPSAAVDEAPPAPATTGAVEPSPPAPAPAGTAAPAPAGTAAPAPSTP
jgi:membrane protease subunit HflC